GQQHGGVLARTGRSGGAGARAPRVAQEPLGPGIAVGCLRRSASARAGAASTWAPVRAPSPRCSRTGGRAPARRPRRIALSTSCPMRRTTEGDDIARSQTDCGMDDDGSRIRCESRNRTVAARLEASSELANILRAGRGGRIADLDADARLRAARPQLDSVRT